MYLNQMVKTPLLTREQEIAIFKRIEEADQEVKQLIYGFGFAAKEHIAIAEKLLLEPPRERFDRIVVDNKIASRESHLKDLRRLVMRAQALDAQADEHYETWRKGANSNQREKLFASFLKLDKKLQALFQKFFYKQKAIEDMILVAGNVHVKFQAVLRRLQKLVGQPKSVARETALREEN